MYYDDKKLYTFLRGAASVAELPQTLAALPYAREQHKNQYRASGEPYILHPLMLACHICALSDKKDKEYLDTLLAAALLHDVCEDCGRALHDLPVSQEVKTVIGLLTFEVIPGETKASAKKRYYRDIADSRAATTVKLIDRCHNTSTMAGPFTFERMQKYLDETNEFILPLLETAMIRYPQDSNQLFILKYHLTSLLDLAGRCLESEKDTAGGRKTPDPETEEKGREDGPVYVLEQERPEILGSGSDTQEIKQTRDLEEVLALLRAGRGNRLTRYMRVDGRLTTQVWDETQGSFA